MNKLTCSTLALFLTGSAALASDGEWSTIEQEVNALSSTLSSADQGATIFGRVRTYYTSQVDGVAAGVDSGGVSLKNARLGAKGKHGNYGYKLQAEFKSGTPALLDAYGTFGIGDQAKGTFGQFKSGVARASRISSGRMLFTNRNIIGSAFSKRTSGLMLGGELSQMGWEISIMNGEDGTTDELLFAGRLTASLMGSGPGKVEGAYGGTEDPSLSAAVAFVDDGDFGDAVVLEVNSGTNLWSFDVAVCDAGENGSGGSLGTEIAADSTPISVQGSYMLQPDKWELGVRFQDFDNAAAGADSTTRTDLSINNYIDGHSLKWMLNVQTDDEGANDESQVSLGLQVSF